MVELNENIEDRTLLKDMRDLRSQGIRAKAYQGDYAGGQPPYGYKAEKGHLHIEPHEAECVRFIFALRDKGASFGYIVAQLEANKVLTRRGSHFTRPAVAKIIAKRKFYEGYYKYADLDWRKGRHRPLIKEKDDEVTL